MDIQKIKVKLSGISDIMFDKFIDHSKEVRPPEQKLYLAENNKAVFPAENLRSFMFGETPAGCAKTFEGKKSKDYIRFGMGHVFIDPILIPLKSNGKEIKFKGFDKEFWIHSGAPRTKSGSLSIKQEIKQRPVLKMPWNIEFTISLIKNPLINSTKLYNWFTSGGFLIALGTYRPLFGRFEVSEWEV